jgi:5-methyltetrahydrofolate--homocysteine methyltransferase
MTYLDEIVAKLQDGDEGGVAGLTRAALDDGLAPQSILDGGLIPGMTVVGQRFSDFEIFLPDMLLAAQAMQSAVDVLEPYFLDGEMTAAGTVVLGTVRGDLHDIGKNLVGIMLKGVGFRVIDLGKDVAPVSFVDAAVEHEANVIGMSALLTTTAPVMAEVVSLLGERGLSERIRTIVGGAPMSTQLAASLGADAYAFDAPSAVDRVQELVAASA